MLQPVIVFALLAIGIVSFTGIGIQQVESWNQIDVWVQQYGWAEQDIESPVSNFSIELILEKKLNDNGTPELIDDFFETFVKGCIFRSSDDILAGTGLAEGKMVCKLLNADGDAIAENSKFFSSYTANDPINIIGFSKISSDSIKLDNVFDARAIVESPI